MRGFSIFAVATVLSGVVMLCLANMPSHSGFSVIVAWGGCLICLLGVLAVPLIISERSTERNLVGAATLFAFMIAFLLALDFVERSGAGRVGSGIGPLGTCLLLPLAGFVSGLIRYPHMRRLPLQSFWLTLLGLLTGWWVGMLLWSQGLPSQILADAAMHAGDRPYCIVSGGKAVERRGDLVGLNGTRLRLQVVHITDGRALRYLRWSNTLGRFTRFEFLGAEEVERAFHCSPQRGFASRIPA